MPWCHALSLPPARLALPPRRVAMHGTVLRHEWVHVRSHFQTRAKTPCERPALWEKGPGHVLHGTLRERVARHRGVENSPYPVHFIDSRLVLTHSLGYQP